MASGCSEGVPPLRPLAGDALVLAFGDSLTYGTGAEKTESYPEALSDLIQRRVINAGIPGEISAAGAARLGTLLEQLKPHLVVLCHGGNDILRRLDRAALRANLEQMIRESQDAGADVVLVAVPDFGLLLSAADDYQAVATTTGVPLEREILPEVLADRGLKSDTIHPNAEGYRRLAEAVSDLLHEQGAL